MTRTRLALLAAALLSSAPLDAPAATVEGIIPLAPPAEAVESVDLYGKYRVGEAPEDAIIPALAVVALAPREGTIAAPPAGAPVMDQSGLQFRPRILAVRTGTTVKFTNSDDVFHNVFSLSPAKRFDLGRYGHGDAESVTFDRAGTVAVFCDIHPQMQAYVVIVDAPFVCVTDARGAYRFENVPPGAYELRVWKGDYARPTHWSTVTVAGDGTVAAVPAAR